MKQLPGFFYDARKKRAVFDGYVPGTHGRVRRQRTVENVSRDRALSEWSSFRTELQSGRAIDGPLTLRQFVARFYDVIAARHEESTRRTQRNIIKNHLLRYFGDTDVGAITTIRVIDLMADMRKKNCSAAYINDAVRLLKMLLRQAVERDVIADYPIKKRVPKEKEPPLRLELRADERTRFFATFNDEAAFRRRIDSRRQLGPTKESSHFGTARRFGGCGAQKLRIRGLESSTVVRTLFVRSTMGLEAGFRTGITRARKESHNPSRHTSRVRRGWSIAAK